MTDNTQAPEYLQEQLVKQGNVSSMRYIGDDYTRIIEIREDRLLEIITAYTNKQTEEVLDRLLEHGEDFTTFGDGSRSVAVEYIKAERNRLNPSKSTPFNKLKEKK